jgi:hypothetical protein
VVTLWETARHDLPRLINRLDSYLAQHPPLPAPET